MSVETITKEEVLVARDEIIDLFNSARRMLPEGKGLQTYIPQATDVLVTSFPKAGTTLTQQLVYQVCVFGGGAPKDDPHGENFEDISDKVPWINYIHRVSMSSESQPEPRLFKTHSPPSRFRPNAQKHIVLLRDPSAFPSSWLDFSFGCFPSIADRVGDDQDIKQALFDHIYQSVILGTKKIYVDESDAFYKNNEGGDIGLGPWFKWTMAWIERATECETVLLLFYEDVVKNMPDNVLKVAEFLDKSLLQTDVDEICRRCSKEYMLEDERFRSKWDARIVGVDPTCDKVLPDRQDGFKKLNCNNQDLAETRRQMKQSFQCNTYEELKSIEILKCPVKNG